MIKYIKSKDIMKGEIRISIATAIIAAIIYSAASFSILSLSQSYAFAQTQGNAGLSLTNCCTY
jgi:hypothetical protein